jgi:Domain of unknown function (DUF4384)
MINDAFNESTRTDPGVLSRVRDPRNRAAWERFIARKFRAGGTLNQLIVLSFTMSHRPVSSIPATELPPGVGSRPPGERNTIRKRPQTPPVDLRLTVSRQVGPRHLVAFAMSRSQSPPGRLTRDMKKAPPSPDQALLPTGDRIRIGVCIDPPGFLSAFNVGPAGRSNVLYPDADLQPDNQSQPIEPSRPLYILDAVTAAPTGRERLFAVWSRQPLPLRLDQLQNLVGQNEGRSPPSCPYVATRDIIRLADLVHQSQPESRHVVVIEVDHVK